MFAAIRAVYDIPRDENLKLRDYPTLAQVIGFVHAKRPDLAGSAVATPAVVTTVAHVVAPADPAPKVAPTIQEESIEERILALMVEKTGYPKEMLDLDLDLEADLGVDTVKQAEMFAAIRGIYNIPRDESRKLRDYPTLAHVIRFVFEKRPDLAESGPAQASSAAAAPVVSPSQPEAA